MSEELDSAVQWRTQYIIVIKRYFDTPEEAQEMVDEINDCTGIHAFVDGVKVSS